MNAELRSLFFGVFFVCVVISYCRVEGFHRSSTGKRPPEFPNTSNPKRSKLSTMTKTVVNAAE
jgi:hypothetical protein